ncbi:MAG: DUF2252 family protein [Myxococcales bacterium]|nr:DUF2252 family protein [Myxococcales bacterium]
MIDLDRALDGVMRRRAARVARFPFLAEVIDARRGASAHAFLRGEVPLFYELIAMSPEVARLPADGGVIVGDLHLENVGAWRTDEGPGALVFDLNDLDCAGRGPWRVDLLRLTTSLFLSREGSGLDVGAQHAEALAMLDAWRGALETGRLPTTPPAVEKLLRKAEGRSRQSFLAARTEKVDGRTRFLRGPRYRDVARGLAREVTESVEAHLMARTREAHTVADVAFRIAGNGSLGGLRLALLVESAQRVKVFDLKEVEPLPSTALRPLDDDPGAALLAGARALLGALPRGLDTLDLGGRAMALRRLTPQEDKLDLARVEPSERAGLFRYLGALVGRAHRRGADRATARWRDDTLRATVETAARLEGATTTLWRLYALSLAP